ncbi:ComEC/Rec2 family competence protein [Leifsonella bigeumensis]
MGARFGRVDARLAIPAAAGWVVLGAILGMPGLLAPAAVGAWVVSALCGAAALVAGRGRRVLATLTVVGVACALLLTSAAIHSAARRPAALLDAASSGRYLRVVAVLGETVTARPPAGAGLSTGRPGPVRVTITDAVIGGTSLEGIEVPALLFGSAPVGGIGTVIEASGTIAGAAPGESAQFLLFARGSPAAVAGPPWFLDWANGLRSSFLAASAALPGDGGALLPGLAIGDTSRVGDALGRSMKATSLSHLTAVSGANCAVVVGLIMLGGAALGFSRRTRIAASVVVLAGFVVLVTPEASVLRAAVMAGLVLGALLAGRPASGVPVLSLAIVILLTVDPWLSRSYGFILSVLATAGLLVLSGPLAALFARWLPAWLAMLVSIPLAAQLACQPVLILLNPAVPVYGVVANILSEPAAPIATVLGLAACIVLPVFEPLGRVLAAIAWLPASWIAAVARFFSALPAAQAPWVPGMVGVALLAAVTALVLVVLFRRRDRATRMLGILLVASLLAYSSSLLGLGLGRRMSLPHDWQVAACDIGQGDAVLVRSAGEVALIDTGPDPARLARCLDELGIRRIRLLVLSHYDLDHVGGTSAVLGMVEQAIVGPVSDEHDTALRTSLADAGAEVHEAARGTVGTLGDLRWEVLWPPSRLGTLEPGNAASVVVRFEGVGPCPQGCLSSLFLGDLGEESQSRMLGMARPAPVDLVKVAHHGSADQSARLYERLHARVGIVSAGAENTYGHPTDRLLGILQDAGTAIARTDLEGMILVSPGPGGTVSVWTERAAGRDVGAH